MRVKCQVKTIKTLLLIIVATAIIGLTGCSANKSNVKQKEQIKGDTLSNLPADIRLQVERLNSPNASMKTYGAVMLGKAGRYAVPAVPFLIEVLHEEDYSVKEPIIKALGQIGDSRAVGPLVAILQDRSNHHRDDAARALGQIGSPRAVDALITMLNVMYTLDTSVIENTIWSLGEIKDPQAIRPLILVLKEKADLAAEALWKIDPDWQKSDAVKQNIPDFIAEFKGARLDEQKCAKITDALSKMGPNVINPMLTMMVDENADIRKQAAHTLKKLDWQPVHNSPEFFSYLIASQNWEGLVKTGVSVVPYLTATLRDKDKDVRMAVARTLILFKWRAKSEDEVISFLIASQKWDELCAICSPAVDQLIITLQDKDAGIRENAARALVKIGISSIEPLISTLKDKREYTRSIAAVTLDKIDASWQESEEAKQAIPDFIASLNDNDKDVACSAAWALSIIKDERSIEPLIKALDDDDSGVQSYAARALGKLSDTHASKPLIAKLHDEDSVVRGYVALALGDIKSPIAIKPLLNLLRDKDSWPRESAKKALSKINPDWVNSVVARHSVPSFILSLSDDNKNVRKGAAKALGDLGYASAVDPLIAKIHDENTDMRSTVVRALGKIMDTRAIEPLIDTLSDEDVKVLATKALEKITGEHFGDNQDAWRKWLKSMCDKSLEFCSYNKMVKNMQL